MPDEDNDWKGKIAILVGGAILLMLLTIVCSHSCPPGTTWDNGKGCCVNGLGNCAGSCWPDVTDPTCPASCQCHPAGLPCTCGCGNLVCEPALGEDSHTCPIDCGAATAVPICGDGSCRFTESCSSCPADCGVCPSFSCKGVTELCGVDPCCTGLNCAPDHCCPGETSWDGLQGCCVDASGICICESNGYTPCNAPAECCSGNCNLLHCCPVVGGVNTIWNNADNCCQMPAGDCVCYGKSGDCSGDSDCCSGFTCSNNHCCGAGEQWDLGLSCCANTTTHQCTCKGPVSSCTASNQCCTGLACSPDHCCPTVPLTTWNATAGCCQDSAGTCIADFGPWGWYCLGSIGGSGTSTPPTNPSTCGNHLIDPGETCSSCPIDVGACLPCSPPNGVCEIGENCINCAADCTTTIPALPPEDHNFSVAYASSAGNFSTFTHTFTVSAGTINTATLDLQLDDCGIVQLNGQVVPGPWGCIQEAHLYTGIDIKPYIVAGSNTFNFQVWDVPGVFTGYNLVVRVTYLPSTQCCGDGACTGTETCSSCLGDCGPCASVCGDGSCNGGETCTTCPTDCGTCPDICGDGSCTGTETCSSCPGDCGPCCVQLTWGCIPNSSPYCCEGGCGRPNSLTSYKCGLFPGESCANNAVCCSRQCIGGVCGPLGPEGECSGPSGEP